MLVWLGRFVHACRPWDPSGAPEIGFVTWLSNVVMPLLLVCDAKKHCGGGAKRCDIECAMRRKTCFWWSLCNGCLQMSWQNPDHNSPCTGFELDFSAMIKEFSSMLKPEHSHWLQMAGSEWMNLNVTDVCASLNLAIVGCVHCYTVGFNLNFNYSWVWLECRWKNGPHRVRVRSPNKVSSIKFVDVSLTEVTKTTQAVWNQKVTEYSIESIHEDVSSTARYTTDHSKVRGIGNGTLTSHIEEVAITVQWNCKTVL